MCTSQAGLFEMSRLCLRPDVQQREPNLASWFVARTIRALRQTTEVRAILTYADADVHTGTLYRALSFQYYGLSQSKVDFWVRDADDGSFSKHRRGPTLGLEGEWRRRSRKHRFLRVFDRALAKRLRWTECDWRQTLASLEHTTNTSSAAGGVPLVASVAPPPAAPVNEELTDTAAATTTHGKRKR
ncbi:Hypothetical protein UVM_LOCUS142 [uncultured virus]|nr:Hypothetical protein UVM_LOCUS142 [uncultured virus]